MSVCPKCFEDIGCTCKEQERIAALEYQLAEAKITVDHLRQGMCPKSSDCPYSDMAMENKRLRAALKEALTNKP